jgi:hypothetical protein
MTNDSKMLSEATLRSLLDTLKARRIDTETYLERYSSAHLMVLNHIGHTDLNARRKFNQAATTIRNLTSDLEDMIETAIHAKVNE